MKYIEKCVVEHIVGEVREGLSVAIEIEGSPAEVDSFLNWAKERIESQLERISAKENTEIEN
jgi:hypothetical protein